MHHRNQFRSVRERIIALDVRRLELRQTLQQNALNQRVQPERHSEIRLQSN
jgi:hypothetical protein